MGKIQFTKGAHGLISEHWENVGEGPISITQHGYIEDRPHNDRIHRHASLVAEACLRDLADNDIAENHKSCCHEKHANNNNDNNGSALLCELAFAQTCRECHQNKQTQTRGCDPTSRS